MTDPRAVSTAVAGVVQALSNGLRSEIEIAKQARLPLDRVRVALDCLVARRCVIGSPQTPGGTMFRLSDNGNDMLKVANAAERKLRL
jgi:hypothetical protein